MDALHRHCSGGSDISLTFVEGTADTNELPTSGEAIPEPSTRAYLMVGHTIVGLLCVALVIISFLHNG